MKIIINHNINYKIALRRLFESLLETNFLNYNDVVIVASGDSSDSEPKTEKLSNIIDFNCDKEVTLIRMKMNNFDYVGYHALYLYKDNPLIKDEKYLYVLDTVTFVKDFYDLYKRIICEPDQIITYFYPNANICVFGKEVINNYKDNFSKKVSKIQAVHLENDKEVILNNVIVKPLSRFGRTFVVSRRILLGEEEIYHVNCKRKKYYYPQLGILKWVGEYPGNEFFLNYEEIEVNEYKYNTTVRSRILKKASSL